MEQKKQLALRGKAIFDWKAQQLGITEEHEVINDLLAYFKIRSIFEFYFQLGAHKIDVKSLQEFIEMKKEMLLKGEKRVDISRKQRKENPENKTFEDIIRKTRGVTTDSLLIAEDVDKIDYQFAPCCQPIPGDEIVGFVAPKKGIVIHRTNCEIAVTLMSNYGSSIVKAKWTNDADITFLAGMKIIGEDKIGMMNNLIRVISINMKINIRSITIDTEDGIYEGVFKLFVHNTGELNRLMENLRKVGGVFSVGRVDAIQ